MERFVTIHADPALPTRGTTPAVDGGPGRSLRRRRALPGGRAVAGGFLVALAAVGIFAAYTDATADTRQAYVVARRPLALGQRLSGADFSIAFMAQRELTSAAAAAANDAAAAALSEQAFYRGQAAGAVVIDGAAARRVVERSLAARTPRGVTVSDAPVVQHLGRQVCVRVRGRVAYLFAKTVPGMPDHTTVEGRAVATAVRGEEDAGGVPGRQLSC